MQTIIVDTTPGFRQPTIHYSQNDVGTTFAIDLRSRFGDTLPASPTVKIQATKPSGFGFSIEADSVVDSVATFTTVATMTDEAGRFPAELEVSDSGVVLYTANFYMEGEANPHPIGTTDGSQETIIPTLTLLVERVEAAAESVLDMTVNATTLAAGSQATYSYDENTNTATFGIPQGEAGAGAAGVTASAYSSSKTYAVGDYVIHNSNLYRCTTAITTAEAFTAAHWTQVALANDVSDVKSEISNCEDQIFVDTPCVFETVDNSYINTSGVLSTASLFHRSSMIDIQAYDAIITSFDYNGSDVSPIAFYRTLDDFTSASRVSIVATSNAGTPVQIPDEAKYVVLSSPKVTTLGVYGRKNAIDELQHSIEKNTSDIASVESNFTTNGHLNEASSVWSVKSNYYASSAGWVENTGYTSYYFITEDAINIYSDGAAANDYYSITLFSGSVSNTNYINRYRKSDNNLPTEQNPINVPANTVVVVSILSTDAGFTLDTDYPFNKALADDIRLGTQQRVEVAEIANTQSIKIHYVTGTFQQGATEAIYVYMPTYIGYIQYILLHCINASTNADSWHIYRANSVDNNLSSAFELTTDGEWECALLLSGRNDYCGGYAHGDEISTNISVYIDGKEVELSELANITDAKIVEIVETSTLYDPVDSTTEVAEHGRRYVFNNNELSIFQTLKWKYSGSLEDCYLAMFPPKKITTDTYFVDDTYNPETINVSQPIYKNNIAFVCVYKNSIGFMAEISTPVYPSDIVGSGVFSLRDNNGGAYNKIYFQASGHGATVAAGDVWKSKTIYKLCKNNS